jgi:hypothetical protein
MDSGAHSFLHSSRLVRRLRTLDVVNVQPSHGPFSERFGQLFDLSGTVIISQMLEDLSDVASATTTRRTIEAITDEFLEERKALIHYIAMRFQPGTAHGKGKLPTASEFHAHCEFADVYATASLTLSNHHSAVFEPYREFYVTLQSKLAGKIHPIHTHIGDAISRICPEFAQLTALDKAMARALYGQHRQLFGVVPRLLGKRFGSLFGEHLSAIAGKPEVRDVEQWMGAQGWLSAFCRQMQEVLLSELEIRLQPAQGLIETLFDSTFGAQLPSLHP